jgi:hypothetical protein
MKRADSTPSVFGSVADQAGDGPPALRPGGAKTDRLVLS